MSQETKRLILYTAYISVLTVSLLISAKITTLIGLTFTVGAFAYAITFPITDTISEVYGRKEAQTLVYLGFIAYLMVVLYSQLAVYLPSANFWQENQDAYETVIGLVPRIVIASFISYTISQYHDVWAFHFWKKITNGKHLWLRNNASTISSQIIDTVIFVTIAFYAVVPNNVLVEMMIGQFLIKMIIAIVDTPIVYMLVSWLKK
jgi:uncharacterized integral membrane protein (TIGR00697 family)